MIIRHQFWGLNMNKQKEFKFYMIELLDPPDPNFDKYICVPHSWIRLRETMDGIAVVKFPIEKLSETKKRVQNEEKYSNDWTIFLADIKYGTNSYEDATNYILYKMSIQEQHIKEVEGMPSPGTNEVHRTLMSSGTKPTRNQTMPEQLQLTNPEVEAHQEKTEIVETIDSTIKPRKYLTRQSFKVSSPAKTINSPDQTAQENSKETNNSVEESSKAKCNQENESSVNNPPKSMNKSEFLAILRPLFRGNFKEMLKKLHADCKRNEIMFEKMRLVFLQHCTLLEEFIELTDQFNAFDTSHCNATATEEGNAIIEGEKTVNKEVNEVTGLGKQKKTRGKEEEKGNNDGGKNKTKGDEGRNNPLDKVRGQARKFTLPPEYDPNDSKWTLKHRKKRGGLVELTSLSGVYVDANNLNNCIRLSKDSKTFARMLLVEIFSESALSICSLTGKKANVFDVEGTNIRPGLDEHARTILLNYVEQHARSQNWVKSDTHTILNSLRNKIQEIRSKHE